jgi:ABC-type antimicrobial peptide transport system permease subunit
LNVVVRVSGAEPVALVAPLRRLVAEIDPALAVSGIESMSEVLAASVAAPRFVTAILALFGAIATWLSVTGVYGVVATGVAQRRRELAIRRSLGAGAGAVASLVLGQTRSPVAAGLALGAVAALVTSRWLLPFLFEVPAASPGRLLAASGLLATVAAIACVAPLARALRLDPARALRDD